MRGFTIIILFFFCQIAFAQTFSVNFNLLADNTLQVEIINNTPSPVTFDQVSAVGFFVSAGGAFITGGSPNPNAGPIPLTYNSGDDAITMSVISQSLPSAVTIGVGEKWDVGGLSVIPGSYSAGDFATNGGVFPQLASITVRNSATGGGDQQFQLTAGVTLPITITSISATKLSESSARVDWSTSIELNSSHFIVQRSADLRNWESLGRVDAAGDSREVIDYSFIDNTIPRTLRSGDGTFYYRLVAIDLDEAFEISEVRSLTFDVVSSMINVYPNPTSDLVVVDLGDMEGDAQLTMMDLQGRVVYTMLATDEHNRMPVINLTEHGFEAGTYLIRIEDKTTEVVETRKVLLID